MAHTLALQLCISVPIAEVLAVPAQELRDLVGFIGGFGASFSDNLDFGECVGFWACGCCHCSGYLMLGLRFGAVLVCCVWWLSIELGWFLNTSIFWDLGICQIFYCFWDPAVVLNFFPNFLFYFIFLAHIHLYPTQRSHFLDNFCLFLFFFEAWNSGAIES